MSATIAIQFVFWARPDGLYFPVGLQGTLTTTGNDVYQATATVSTAAATIPLGAASTRGLFLIANTGATNIKLGRTSGMLAADTFGLVKPGEFAVFEPYATATYFQAVGSASTAEILHIEGPLAGSLTPVDPTVGSTVFGASLSIRWEAGGFSGTTSHGFTSDDTGGLLEHKTQLLSTDTSFTNYGNAYLVAHNVRADTTDVALRCNGVGSSEFAILRQPVGAVSTGGMPFCFIPVSPLNNPQFVTSPADANHYPLLRHLVVGRP